MGRPQRALDRDRSPGSRSASGLLPGRVAASHQLAQISVHVLDPSRCDFRCVRNIPVPSRLSVEGYAFTALAPLLESEAEIRRPGSICDRDGLGIRLGAWNNFVLGTVIFLEFFDRISGDPQKLWESATGVFIPAAYLFTGLVLVFCYNDLTASLRFVGSYDATFNRLDAVLFHGFTVSALSHAAARYFSLGFFKFLEFIYYGMFNQIGAALIIIPLCLGRKRALEFAGTVLTAYYLALVIFFVWPTIGPFSICPTHFADFPHSLATYGFQKIFVTKAQGFLTHQMPFRVDTDFYIAFPSMHIAQPLIVLWFLRRWKRITLFLLAYDVILVGAILLLEWHYFVDLIGGILIAALAIAVVEPKRLEVEPMNSEQPLCVGTYAEPLSVSTVSTTKWNKS